MFGMEKRFSAPQRLGGGLQLFDEPVGAQVDVYHHHQTLGVSGRKIGPQGPARARQGLEIQGFPKKPPDPFEPGGDGVGIQA